MDPISKVIIKRVLNLNEDKPYIKFALFKLYHSDFLMDILYREFGIKIKDVEYSKNGIHGVFIYKCMLQKEDPPNDLIRIQIEEILKQYELLIQNNLLMVNPNWPYKLINIRNGKDTLKTIVGDARELVREMWVNNNYKVFIKYKGTESVLELMSI